MTRKEIKAMARLQIDGKIGAFFLVSLVGGLVGSIGSGFPLIGAIISLVLSSAMSLGMIHIRLHVAFERSYRPRVGDLFEGFHNFWPFLKVTLLSSLITMLWSILFIIPGIIKALAYSQAPYIIAENPNMPVMEALRLSERMMKGKKWDFFVLNLSFFGWALLSIPTLGLIMIWLDPYMQMSAVNFYNDVKRNFEQFFYAPPPPFGYQL